MGFLPTIRQGSTSILNKHIGAWLGPATERYEEAHGTGWIVVHGRLRCAPGHLRHLSERESSALDRDKRDTEKARTSRTLYRILSSRVGLTRIFEASPTLQMGRNRVISIRKISESFTCRVWHDLKRCATRDEIHCCTNCFSERYKHGGYLVCSAEHESPRARHNNG